MAMRNTVQSTHTLYKTTLAMARPHVIKKKKSVKSMFAEHQVSCLQIVINSRDE